MRGRVGGRSRFWESSEEGEGKGGWKIVMVMIVLVGFLDE